MSCIVFVRSVSVSVFCLTSMNPIVSIFFFFLQEAWLLSRERELKDELRRERDKEIELAIWTLEEETSKDKEECERAADNR